LLGTIPDGVRRDGRPAAVSSLENFARFYFPPKEKEPKSNLEKISGESYPFRGWPQKQAGVYTSDTNREWFGQLKDATNHHGCPVRRRGMSAAHPLNG
jgi:hypothetical protein